VSVKAGFVLRAYLYRSHAGGNAVVFAVPADDPVLVPTSFDDRPAHALESYLDALEADGSPQSYLAVSLFAREVSELGAYWHGLNWSMKEVLGTDPFKGSSAKGGEFRRRDESGWEWVAPRPDEAMWLPTVDQDPTGTTVISLHIYDPVGSETLQREDDLYPANGCRFQVKTEVLARGPGGLVF